MFCRGYLLNTAAILVAVLAGCSSGGAAGSRSIAKLSNAASYDKLEVAATPEDQARQEVLSTPTDFFVTIEQDRFAWERARFFLENYGAGGGASNNAVVKVVGARRGLASAPGPSPYTYEVFKDFSTEGFRYSVRCLADPAISAAAALNAGNFARFIREGKLEVSLLAH